MTRDEMRAVIRGTLHRLHPDPYADRWDGLVDAFELGLVAGAVWTNWADGYADTVSEDDHDQYMAEAEALTRAIPLR